MTESREDALRRQAEKHQRLALQHRHRAARLASKGKPEQARRETRLADRSTALMNRALDQIERLYRQDRLSHARNAAAHRMRPSLDRYARSIESRARDARAPPQRAPTPEGVDPAEAKRQARREKAGIETDTRTAAGRRHVDVVNLGPALRASVNHFNACISRREDRTPARILAWSAFDTHCHKVKAGEIPSPKYEPGVDVSQPPSVSDSRLDALRQDELLRNYLGADYHELLIAVIYHQRTFKELASTPREAEIIGYMFKRALDHVAAHWHIGGEELKAQSMERALWVANRAAES